MLAGLPQQPDHGAVHGANRQRVDLHRPYLMEKTKSQKGLNLALRMLSFVPMAVPGLVLGLGYVFFFNLPGNPLHVLYGTMTLLVVCTIAHYLTTAQMTATTALRQLDGEFEAAALSLKALSSRLSH